MNESDRIMNKYPDRIPIIVKKRKGSDAPSIDKSKYLVPKDMAINQFTFIIRKRLKLEPSKALFVTINGNLPVSNEQINDIYLREKNEDGFLYIIYSFENTFG